MKELPWWRQPSREQWTSFGAAWAGWVLDAFDFAVFLLAMPAIMKEFGVSSTATAAVTTATLLVRLLGGVLAGAAADRWGRKLPLLISIVWFALCDGAVAMAPTFSVVLILRVLFGLGMGAEWTAGTTLAMESWPEKSRGIGSGLLQIGWPVGYMLASVAAAIVIPAYGWRALFVLAALPALLVLPLRYMIPEEKGGRRPEASQRPPPSFADLMDPTIRRTILWACIPMSFGFGAYYALSGLYSVMLVRELHVPESQMAGYSALFFGGMLVGSILTGFLAHRKGVSVAIAIPALLTLPVLPLYCGWQPGLLGLGAFLVGALGVGWSGVSAAFLTGLFPEHVRAKAVGIVYHVGACFGALAMTAPALLTDYAALPLTLSIPVVAGLCEIFLALSLLAKPAVAGAREETAPEAPLALESGDLQPVFSRA